MENDRAQTEKAQTDRAKMIQQTLLQMDKQFGKGAVLHWVRGTHKPLP